MIDMGDRNPCSAIDCTKPVWARELCNTHYRRLLRSGAVERSVRRTPASRSFWNTVKTTDTGCWEWTGQRSRAGYGTFIVSGRRFLAHRQAYHLRHGVDPGDFMVCHTCDNPPCINPDHLFLGTAADNNADMVSKGRHSHGVTHGSAKLTEPEVHAIRAMREAGGTLGDISRRFEVSEAMVVRIADGRNWAHVVSIDKSPA